MSTAGVSGGAGIEWLIERVGAMRSLRLLCGLFVLAFVCSVFPLLCLPLSSCCLSAILAQHWLWSAADTVDLKVQMASQGSAHSQSVWPFHGLPACLYRA